MLETCACILIVIGLLCTLSFMATLGVFLWVFMRPLTTLVVRKKIEEIENEDTADAVKAEKERAQVGQIEKE